MLSLGGLKATLLMKLGVQYQVLKGVLSDCHVYVYERVLENVFKNCINEMELSCGPCGR